MLKRTLRRLTFSGGGSLRELRLMGGQVWWSRQAVSVTTEKQHGVPFCQ